MMDSEGGSIVTAWHVPPEDPDSEPGGPRYMSGGYDFGGYIPGEDYLPKKKPWKPFFAIVGVLLIIAIVVWSVLAIF
ncbi:MAG: hypothetical protein LKK46_09510 [Ancrocorticia sp.]|jgi:hypothetical protein|nr:hypothetical protein [Ancrocorticia sp.]